MMTKNDYPTLDTIGHANGDVNSKQVLNDNKEYEIRIQRFDSNYSTLYSYTAG